MDEKVRSRSNPAVNTVYRSSRELPPMLSKLVLAHKPPPPSLCWGGFRSSPASVRLSQHSLLTCGKLLQEAVKLRAETCKSSRSAGCLDTYCSDPGPGSADVLQPLCSRWPDR